jgi:hypothetical protein
MPTLKTSKHFIWDSMMMARLVAAMELVAKVINHFYVKILPLMSLVRGRYMCSLVVILYEGIS